MEKNNSFWLKSNKIKSFNNLTKDIDVDVCIVGGGLTGISTAYYLSKKGYKIAIIEKDKVLSKTSGHTTAKITSQHGLFYKYLYDSKGENFAKKYLEANETAIKNIEKIIVAENIQCDFENKSAYVFTQKINELEKIKEEVETVKKLNVVACDYVDKIELNLDIKGAIEFKNQAQFNPIKYANGLLEIIEKKDGLIFENTGFIDYEKIDKQFIIKTNTKNKIKCQNLVLTTRYPIINFPGYYFFKMYQEMSYCIAIKPKKDIELKGMYINYETPTFSIKTAKLNGENVVFVSGLNNKTGDTEELKDKYEKLRVKAYEIFGDYEFLYEWNTEDCITLDKIPYIGEFSNFTDNLYVATGFEKWGMTTSNVAANIITDKIINGKSMYEDIFKATRVEAVKNEEELKNMIKQSIKSLIIDKLKTPKEAIDDIKNDEGKIVMVGNEKVGVYKDKSGNIYAVRPVCTHLGCELAWNDLNKTWDCPCHGSRFEYTGKSIYSPSMKDLENYNFE